MDAPSRLRRSLLFVPGADDRKLERAHTAGADVLLLDLEDSVAPERKAEARTLVAERVRKTGAGECELAVRINPPASPWFQADLEALIQAGARTLMLPKAESARGIEQVVHEIENVERGCGIDGADRVRLLALIETPGGILDARAVADASERVEALCFGHADFSLEMGLVEADAAKGAVLHARCQLAIAARACGIAPVDTVFLAVRDGEGFRADAELGRELGFEGKLCIHPAQVERANRVHTPSPEQVERATAIVEGWRQALAEGRGVFALDGKMVDAPVVAVQERLLERARRAGVA